MKIVLMLILCSGVSKNCVEPYEWPVKFPDIYECMIAGYEESKNKTLEIGRSDVNKFDVYVKFVCAPLPET